MTTDVGSITDIIIIDSGVGYLPAPNGSTGGGGQLFSKPDQTVVYTPSREEYQVFAPGELVEFEKGDIIYPPAGTVSELYDTEGNIIQRIFGLGQVTPIEIIDNGVLTIPEVIDEKVNIQIPLDPTKSNGSYPVVLTLKNIVVTNEGINYRKTDKIIINPDHGAELKPNYDDYGRLISVDILKNGIGFTDIPDIYIDSITGVNARMTPIFDVIRIGDLPEDQDIVPPGTPIISVVDCVGRIN